MRVVISKLLTPVPDQNLKYLLRQKWVTSASTYELEEFHSNEKDWK